MIKPRILADLSAAKILGVTAVASGAGGQSLAILDNYRLPRKNDSYHLVIWNGQLWGERFQTSAFQRRRIVGRADRGSLGGKEVISSG